MKNKYQKKRKKKRTDHGLTVILQIVKNQSKQKIQNGTLWSTIRGRTYRDHLWKIYTLVTELMIPQKKRY